MMSNVDLPSYKVAPYAEQNDKWWHKFLPTMKDVKRYVAKGIIIFFLCAIFYGVLGENAAPGSGVFALFVITAFSVLGGKIFGLLRLPPLIGMLLVGFTFRNVESIPYYHHIEKHTIAVLREMALSIILLRAGLGLDREALSKLKAVVIRLTVMPAMTEAISMGLFGHYFLDLPYIFSFMLGFVISAISPEVVLPAVLHYEKEGYGKGKGIIALIIGATSLDDILAITGFTICFSIAFSTKNLTWTIVKAPLEPVLGFILATLFGILFWYFPGQSTKKGLTTYYNILMLILGASAAMFLSERLHVNGMGPLTCIILGFVSAIRMRDDPEQFEVIEDTFLVMWLIAEPVLFSLIGAEVTISVLKDNAAHAIMALAVSLVFRTIMTLLVIFGANLNWKEKFFVCCAYLPKASVQAAIGSQALDYARANDMGKDVLQYGVTVLNVCVLSLLLTAPLASILIKILGPILLTRDPDVPITQSHAHEEEEKAVMGSKKIVTDFSTVRLLPSKKQA